MTWFDLQSHGSPCWDGFVLTNRQLTVRKTSQSFSNNRTNE
jgi:hypothetical protein